MSEDARMTGSTDSADLARRLALRERQIDAALQIAEGLGAKLDIEDLLRETLRVALAAVKAQAGLVILQDPEREVLEVRYAFPESLAPLRGAGVDPKGSVVGRVLESGETRIAQERDAELPGPPEVRAQVEYHPRNMVAVALRSGGRSIGVLQALDMLDGEFDEEDCELLAIIGAQAAAVIENARLAQEAKLAAVANRVGDISHDVKNMLTPIKSCAWTLDEFLKDALAQVDAALEKGRDGAPELAQEVEGALTFVREFHPDAISMLVDASIDVQDRVAEIADCVKGIVSEPTFEWVDPRQVIARVCKPQERVAETAGVALCVEIPDEVPLVPADQKRLFSAVYNLVNNAIPATPAGGTVTIHLEVAPDGDFPEGHCLVIQVIDTGSGMPEEVRAKLFTEDAISTKVGGTGLGTRIVKNAVDAHGGVVTVESELGHGSVFCMRLPLERAGMPPPSA